MSTNEPADQNSTGRDASTDDNNTDTETDTSGRATSPDDRTRFQYDILFVLAQFEREETTSYGLAIKAELEGYYETEVVNHGRLYPNLDTLIDCGLVTKAELDKRTNLYELTDRGRQAVRERAAWGQEAIGR